MSIIMHNRAPSVYSEKWLHKNGTFLLSRSAPSVGSVIPADFSEKLSFCYFFTHLIPEKTNS